jgi:hypothetical protein
MNGPARYPCPACGHLVFAEPVGSYDICPICFWEDDPVQLQHPDLSGGANKVSLIQAQRNFASIGAVEPRLVPHVRRPEPTDTKDPRWRPWDAARDSLSDAVIRTGKDYFDAVTPADEALAADPAALYYWLR